jgi:hypothetical protein
MASKKLEELIQTPPSASLITHSGRRARADRADRYYVFVWNPAIPAVATASIVHAWHGGKHP